MPEGGRCEAFSCCSKLLGEGGNPAPDKAKDRGEVDVRAAGPNSTILPNKLWKSGRQTPVWGGPLRDRAHNRRKLSLGAKGVFSGGGKGVGSRRAKMIYLPQIPDEISPGGK